MAELYADHPDQQTSLIQFFVEFHYYWNDFMVCRTVGYFLLHTISLEIRIADFKGNASGEFVAPSQLEYQIFGHCQDDALKFFYIGCIPVKRTFGRNGFALGVLD